MELRHKELCGVLQPPVAIVCNISLGVRSVAHTMGFLNRSVWVEGRRGFGVSSECVCLQPLQIHAC